MLRSMSPMTSRALSLSSTTSMRRPRRSGSGSSRRLGPLPRPRRAVNQKVEPTPGGTVHAHLATHQLGQALGDD